jgi:hypothetical protein
MNRWLGVGLSLVFFGSLNSVPADSSMPPGAVCWPLHFSGITLGVTTDSQVQRLLGQGVLRKNEGDAGGRYFIDGKGRATLHAVEYTDAVVGELTILSDIDPEITPAERTRAATKWFSPNEGFGNWHALHLGSSKEDVLKNLGAPEKKKSTDEWTYSTTCACELPEFFTLFFKNGQLFKIVLSAPAG